MAIRHVRNYYYTMQAQYLEMQNDLADFEQAFKDGHITEDRLADVKTDMALVQANYDRLRYIMYLFSLPNKETKERKHNRSIKQQAELFKKFNADLESVKQENESTIQEINKNLTNLIS